LSFEIREGIVKHSRDLAPGERPELDVYLPQFRPPLEAQLIDLADEIAYNTADLDDAFSAELITAEMVASSVPQYAAIHEAVETQFPGASERERFHEGLRQLVDMLVSGLIEGTVARADQGGLADVDDVRNLPVRLAAFTPQAADTSRTLKRFLYSHVYASPGLGADRSRSMAMIAELFEFFLENPDRLPSSYAEQAADEPVHRMVCDYIAGMTDGFFRRTYEQMTGRAASLPQS
jgi:dGTPase